MTSHMQPQSCDTSCCDNPCDWPCNDSDWYGRCCEWTSYPIEIAQLFNGLLIDFGPMSTQLSDTFWRSDIIDLPGSVVKLLPNLEVWSGIFLGTQFYITGIASVSVSYSNFKIAATRLDRLDDSCSQLLHIWFGLTTTISAVVSCDITVRRLSNNSIVHRITNPSDIKDYTGTNLIGGKSVTMPCNGTNFGGNTTGLYLPPGTTECEVNDLSFGWVAPSWVAPDGNGNDLNIKVPGGPSFPTTMFSGYLSFNSWVGSKVKAFFPYSFPSRALALFTDPLKPPFELKTTSSWGLCANAPVQNQSPIPLTDMSLRI